MRSIRRLLEQDADQFARIRREALLESPLAFGASPATDVASSVDGARQQLRHDSAAIVLGAFEDDDSLVGTVGLLRGRHEKTLHKISLWGMFVVPARRGHGIGADLLEEALHHARAMPEVQWVQLTVTSAAPAARRLYELRGFTVWGTEPDALRHDGTSVVEYHMALQLR